MGDISLNILNLFKEELKPGEHFVLKKGVLKKEHTLWSKIKYFFTHKQQDAAVKKFISAEVIKLIEDKSLTDDQKAKLFFNKLAKLPQKIFDRTLITKEFSYILDPTLKATRKKNREVSNQQAKIEHRLKKVQLAQKLGVDLKQIGQGNSGSYFARDYKFKILGVFKPGQEESLGESNPKLIPRIMNLVKKHILGIDSNAPFWANEGYIAEAMTSKVAEQLGFSTVPASKVTKMESQAFHSAKKAKAPKTEEGSFQLFAKNTRSADETFKLDSMGIFGRLLLKLNVWRYKDKISQSLKQEQFEQMALLDFLIFNRDRHFENWLLSPAKEKGKFDINLIDHQLAFPKVNPSKKDIFYRLNQFKWKLFPQAKKQFSPQMRKLVQDQLKGSNLRKMIDALAEVSEGHGKGFKTKLDLVDSSQEIAFKQRVAFIHKGIELGMNMREMAKIKSLEEIEAFLRKFGLEPTEEALNSYLGL